MYRRIRMFRFGRIHLHFSLCSEFSTGLLPPIKYILKHLLIGYKKHYFCHVIICQFISAVWLYLTDLCWELTSSWWFESNNGFLHIHIIRKEVNNIFWGVGILFPSSSSCEYGLLPLFQPSWRHLPKSENFSMIAYRRSDMKDLPIG